MKTKTRPLTADYTYTSVDGSAVTIPALEIDKRNGAATATGENLARLVLERRIVAALLAHLYRKGWDCVRVDDGEEETQMPLTIDSLAARKAVMELVFDLDDVRLYFAPTGDRDGTEHGVLLVLGNGIDVLSDWSYTEGDDDGFNAAMDAFDAEAWV